MSNGKFREQLYHRLRECEIFIPSLAERAEDIPLIVEHYLAKHNRDLQDNKTVAPAAVEYLQEYQWHGNIRELASVLRVALQTMISDQLEVTDLDRILRKSSGRPTTVQPITPPPTLPPVVQRPSETIIKPDVQSESATLSQDRTLKDDIAMVDKLKIEKTLERTFGNVSKSAAILGVSRETLHNKIRKYEIDVQNFRDR